VVGGAGALWVVFGVGGAVVDGDGAAGWTGPERAEQPVTAMALANVTAAMTRTGRMATPPGEARPSVGPGHQLGPDRSRPDDGQATRQARTGLDQVAIVNRNKHTSATNPFPQQAGYRQPTSGPLFRDAPHDGRRGS
jgi:hypothetical protein